MTQLVSTVVAASLAYIYGLDLAYNVFGGLLEQWGIRTRNGLWLTGAIAIFIFVKPTVAALLKKKQPTDDSADMRSLSRRLSAIFAMVMVAILMGTVYLLIAIYVWMPVMAWMESVLPAEWLGADGHLLNTTKGPAAYAYTGFMVITAATAYLAWDIFNFSNVKYWLGIITKPFRNAMRSQMGVGGSAQFAGLLEEWRLRYHRQDILLGASLMDPGWKVGISDPRMILTVAGAGGGKGRSVIIPNLLSWPGSALVIDPKGTNAAVTAAARGKGGGRVRYGMGQDVYCLNPFGVNKDLPGMPPSVRFNPLSTLGPEPSFEDVESIADALVIHSKDDSHFTNSAKAVIRGLIYYACKTIPNANLGHVRDLITHPDGPPRIKMHDLGGLAKEAAAQLMSASDRELGSIMSTAIQQTEWIYGEMRETLSASDFDFMELKNKPTTVYLILPLESLPVHGRFLRLYVNLAVKAATKGGSGKVPQLFLLDEFYSLGRLESLAAALANIRSYNVRIWPILQNIGQIMEHYPQNWQTFIANSGFVQFFSVNDTQTLQYVSVKMGRYVMRGLDGEGRQTILGISDLRTAEEIGRESGRDSGRMLVLREGEDPLLVRRINYDMAWDRCLYNQDPDVPEDRGLRRLWMDTKRSLYLPNPNPPEPSMIFNQLQKWTSAVAVKKGKP